jgi:hypothetical protein
MDRVSCKAQGTDPMRAIPGRIRVMRTQRYSPSFEPLCATHQVPTINYKPDSNIGLLCRALLTAADEP